MDAPLHNLEAERAIIGASLLRPKTHDLPDVQALTPRDFWRGDYAKLFALSRELHAEGRLTIEIFLDRANRLKLLSPEPGFTIGRLTDGVMGGTEEANAREVRRLAALRQRLAEIEEEKRAIVAGEVDPLPAGGAQPCGIGARDLMALDLPAPCYVVQDLLPEGLGLLVGAPKLGKSWLALDLAVAVAAGGPALGGVKTEGGPVLLLALEDSRRRIQTRLGMLLDGASPPESLHVVTLEDAWPRRLPEGLADLSAYIRDRQPRLVILDTLGRLRKPGNGRQNAYAADVHELGALQALAQGTHGLAILALHHTRKAVASDYLESASGSFGVVGTADAILTLTRSRGQADAELKATGRDISEQELALRFDATRGAWTVMGSAEHYRQSNERREILDALRKAREPLAPKEVAEAIGKGSRHASIKHLLRKLEDVGLVKPTGRGRYALTQDEHPNTPSPPSPPSLRSPRSPYSPGERVNDSHDDRSPLKPAPGEENSMLVNGVNKTNGRQEVWR